MSSRRHRDRGRSPSRALDRRDRSQSRRDSDRSIGHREYRQRDYYDQHGYDNGNQPQGHPHPHGTRITGENATVIVQNYYGVAPRDDAAWGYNPVENSQMGKHGEQHPMLPPGRAESERPKRQIPEALRDKCGACRKNHDIRFCPYPNTNDGRTKICPICDTSKHAWYQCAHYDKKDTRLQWEVCWVNRRGLPTIVHDSSLDKIFLKKLDLEDEETPREDHLRTLNSKAGPLSPAFVKRLMPPKDSDDCVQRQLRDGRLLPWHLDKEVLESPMDRPDRVIEDPATKDMQLGNFIPGTKTSDVPKAGKQKYFQSLDQKKRNSEDIQTTRQSTDISTTGLGVATPTTPPPPAPAAINQKSAHQLSYRIGPAITFLNRVSPCADEDFWWPDAITTGLWAVFASDSLAAKNIEYLMQNGRAETAEWYCAKFLGQGQMNFAGTLDENDLCVCDWCEERGHCVQVSLPEAASTTVQLRRVRFPEPSGTASGGIAK